MNRGLIGSIVDANREALEARMKEYFSPMPFGELQKRWPELCTPRAGYEPQQTRERLRKGGYDAKKIVPYVVFPLDARWLYYELEAKLLNRPRPELAEHLNGNEFLVRVPQPRQVSESRPLVLTGLFDLHVHDWGSVGFPAEVNPDAGRGGLFQPAPEELQPTANITGSVWSALRDGWRLRGDLRGEDAKALCRTLFRYCMAVSHAPQYENDHRDALGQDWPHVPIAKDRLMFDSITALGVHLATLLDPFADATPAVTALLGKDVRTLATVHRVGGAHIKESDLAIEFSYYGAASGRRLTRPPTDDEAQRREWGELTGDLYLNEAIFLKNVPDEVWQYELGGYPVLKKWLGYRDVGRRPDTPLTLAELDHLRSIVLRIAAVLSLRPQLDAAYESAAADPWSLEELAR